MERTLLRVRPPISVLVERGGLVESRHRAHAVSCKPNGPRAAIDAVGDGELVTFMRSVAKPLQALALARDAPELTDEELAIACASHEALPDQLHAVRALLSRSDSTEDELECGEERGSKLRHNCSGKHAGMLLVTKRKRWPLPGYRDPGHPLQRELLRVIAEAAELPAAKIPTATDGCGVVTFAMSLRDMAKTFSRLIRHELEGAERIVAAMRARPGLVGGPRAADTLIMRAVRGAIAKRGAEGLLCAALPDGTGVAVKVEDGAARAALPALAYVLGLDDLLEAPLLNSRGDVVGRVFHSP